jgi:hypothetical protein
VSTKLAGAIELAPKASIIITSERTVQVDKLKATIKAGSKLKGKLMANDTGVFCETKVKASFAKAIIYRPMYVTWDQVIAYEMHDRANTSVHSRRSLLDGHEIVEGSTSHTTELVLKTSGNSVTFVLPHPTSWVRNTLSKTFAAIDARNGVPVARQVTCGHCHVTATADGSGLCTNCGARLSVMV